MPAPMRNSYLYQLTRACELVRRTRLELETERDEDDPRVIDLYFADLALSRALKSAGLDMGTTVEHARNARTQAFFKARDESGLIAAGDDSLVVDLMDKDPK